MLKRLLGRNKETLVAEAAEAELQDVVDATLAPAPEPKPPVAEDQRPKRRVKGSRASDIVDEHGRSAEELAAEANAEFDIMGLAARIEQDAPSKPKPRPAPKPKVDASDKPRAAYDMPTPREPEPEPEPELVPAEDTVARPVMVPASEEVPAEPSKAVETAPDVLNMEDGHIFLPSADIEAQAQTRAARDAYWATRGRSEPAFLGYDISPQALGAPAWPTPVQQFRIVRTETSAIIATEGLSQPFGPYTSTREGNGFGVELFLEIPGWQDKPTEEIRHSWAFAAMEQAGWVCARAQTLSELLSDHGVLSVDMPPACAPRGWVSPEAPDPMGALLGVPLPPGQDMMTGMPLSPVRLVPVTLIFPEELEACVLGGAEQRKSLVNDLLTTGHAHRTHPRRASLR